MTPAIWLLVFVGPIVASLAIGAVLSPANSPVGKRVAQLAGPASATLPAAPNRQSIGRLLSDWAAPLVHFLDSGGAIDRLAWQAQVAWTPAELLVGALALGLGTAAAGWYTLPHPLGLLGIGATLLPFVWLQRKARQYRKALVQQLPDALLLIVNALKAGNGLLQALRIVSSQVGAPAGTEFGVVLSEINLGLSVDKAFQNLAMRADQVDVDLAVGAVLVQRETGGNLAEILIHLQDTLRDRARIMGEVQALTAQGRLSGLVLGLLPVGVALLFMLVNPAYLQPFLTDPRGRILLGTAVAGQLLGVWIIRRVVAIRY
ncbi:MAG: type II secretion system F family protein [Cyanobacteria bacterium REEB65]|nr:type II secretion system F family protein [Cyanobacteria bacterium REEB65]